MSRIEAAVASLLLVALFTRVASERARAYDITFEPSRWSALAPSAAAVALSCWMAGVHQHAGLIAAMLACATVCAATDLQTGFVFDRVVLGGLLVEFGCAWLDGTAAASLVAAIATSGVAAALYVLTQRRGIGLGDVKLCAVLGGGLGLTGVVPALECAVLSAAFFGLAACALRRATLASAMPFAPFLALGAAYGTVASG